MDPVPPPGTPPSTPIQPDQPAEGRSPEASQLKTIASSLPHVIHCNLVSSLDDVKQVECNLHKTLVCIICSSRDKIEPQVRVGETDLRATLRAVAELAPVTTFHEPINIRAENVERIQAHANELGVKLKTEVFATVSDGKITLWTRRKRWTVVQGANAPDEDRDRQPHRSYFSLKLSALGP